MYVRRMYGVGEGWWVAAFSSILFVAVLNARFHARDQPSDEFTRWPDSRYMLTAPLAV